jgi:phage regulator Rha-like protein
MILLWYRNLRYLKTYLMAQATKSMSLAEEAIISKIYLVRKHKVMIDRDLAELYGVETKRLKEAVRRNISRFPPDFLFEMTKKEFEDWRTQNASSKEDKQGLRYAPFCFTEQGVTMLSCVLSSDRAIAVNIQVIRVFTKMREMLMTNQQILLKLEQLERKVDGHDVNIQIIFKYLKQLINPPEQPRPRIGFRRKDERE